jgi:hypothetical protein
LTAFTETEIDEMISTYKDAIKAVASGQSYSMDTGQGRISVTRASLPALRRELDYWINEKRQLGTSDIVSLEARR